MNIFVPSWVVPGTYLENLRFLEDKKEIAGVELLFFIYDDETQKLFEREFASIEEYRGRFQFTAHLPEPLSTQHKPLVDMLKPLVKHFIVHPTGSENFPGNDFVLENTELPLFEEALDRLPPGKPVCMDTGHLLLQSLTTKGNENLLKDFIIKYGARIKEVHLHNVDLAAARLDGRLPDHRALRSDDKWLMELLPFLREFNGVVNLEVFSWNEAEQGIRALGELRRS